jgi:hypothetical protein
VKRLLITLVALVVISGGCDAVGGDDVAASVEGTDITVTMVQDLIPAVAKLPSAPTPTIDESDDLMDGGMARFALNVAIQGEIAEHELSALSGSVTQADRDSINEQLGSLEGLSAKEKDLLAELFAPLAALQRVLGAEVSDADVAAAAQEIVDQLPPEQRQQVCFVGVVGPATGKAQAQTLVDGGADVADAAAFAEAGFQAASEGEGAPLCLSLTSVAPELSTALAGTAVGAEGVADFASSQGDATVFFRVTGVQEVGVDDPAVQQQAEQQIAAQADPSALIAKSDAQVDIDPRFGSAFTPAKGVLPPLAPVGTNEPAEPVLTAP